MVAIWQVLCQRRAFFVNKSVYNLRETPIRRITTTGDAGVGLYNSGIYNYRQISYIGLRLNGLSMHPPPPSPPSPTTTTTTSPPPPPSLLPSPALPFPPLLSHSLPTPLPTKCASLPILVSIRRLLYWHSTSAHNVSRSTIYSLRAVGESTLAACSLHTQRRFVYKRRTAVRSTIAMR